MHPLEQSLDIAATRSEDLAPQVYARLFRKHPALEAMFCLDRDGALRGNMLSHAIRVLLDLIDEKSFAPTFLNAEAVTHATNYDVGSDVFTSLYCEIRDEVQSLCGADWSPTMAAAWNDAIQEIGAHVAAGASD